MTGSDTRSWEGGPIGLVLLTGMSSHVDLRWEEPLNEYFLHRLASFSHLILFDRRGAGVSDPVPFDQLPTWEQWADDMRAVLDTIGSERAAIMAWFDGGPMAMLFAVEGESIPALSGVISRA
jgi:pimeloyl-ACP methyl ester carboxylesterase